jgi:hypothetical protein
MCLPSSTEVDAQSLSKKTPDHSKLNYPNILLFSVILDTSAAEEYLISRTWADIPGGISKQGSNQTLHFA